MKRRNFLAGSSAGLVGALHTAPTSADTDRSSLPTSQSPPLPWIGSHWETFEKISKRCRPKLSYLEEEFTDPEAWSEKARAVLEREFHYDPPGCDPEPEIVEKVDRGTHTTERILIQTTPGIRIPVYLLVPKNLERPAPAVVALHDHGGYYFWGKEKVVQTDSEHPELTKFKNQYYGGVSYADELAKKGYIVIASDMMHWGERGLYFESDPPRVKDRTLDVDEEDIKEFNARSWEHEELIGRTALACGATWSGMISKDDARVADYLISRPEVDPDRVGCVGLSIGAVRSWFLGAVHPKVRVSIPVCWTAEYRPMIRDYVRWIIGFTTLVPGLYNHLDWPDLGGLHWPGALLTINGLQDPIYPLEAAEGAFKKIEKIFAKMGVPENYEGAFFEGEHNFDLERQARAFAFLDQHLRDG